MSGVPPISVSNYPRENIDFVRLRALASGCGALFPFFFLNMLVPFGLVCMSLAGQSPKPHVQRSLGYELGYMSGGLFVIGLFFFLFSVPTTYFQLRKFGVGLNWRLGKAALLSAGIGVSWCLCFGLIVYGYVYNEAAKEFKKFGMPNGWWVFHSTKLKAFITQLELQHQGSATNNMQI